MGAGWGGIGARDSCRRGRVVSLWVEGGVMFESGGVFGSGGGDGR